MTWALSILGRVVGTTGPQTEHSRACSKDMEDILQLSRRLKPMAKSNIGSERTLRADAEQNRERIVEAAQALFAERGINVTMEEVARRAGVGIATLHRRFPTRVDLLAGAFEDKMRMFADGAQRALDDPDPWHGFCRFVTTLCAMQSSDLGFNDVLTILLMANAGVVAATGRAAPRSAPRLIGYLLESFAAPGRGALPPPPSYRQITKALMRLNDGKN